MTEELSALRDRLRQQDTEKRRLSELLDLKDTLLKARNKTSLALPLVKTIQTHRDRRPSSLE